MPEAGRSSMQHDTGERVAADGLARDGRRSGRRHRHHVLF